MERMEDPDTIAILRASLAEAEKLAAEYAMAMYAEAERVWIRLQRLETAPREPTGRSRTSGDS